MQISKIFHQIEYYDRLILLSKEKFAKNLMQNWFSLSLHKTQNDEPYERHRRLPGDVIELHKISIINIQGDREREGALLTSILGSSAHKQWQCWMMLCRGVGCKERKTFSTSKFYFILRNLEFTAAVAAFAFFPSFPFDMYERENTAQLFLISKHTQNIMQMIFCIWSIFTPTKKGEDEMLLQLWLGRINFQI